MWHQGLLLSAFLGACHPAEPCGPDGDGDGFAACDDCDDGRAFIRPDAEETCNGFDDDCDGDVDENASDAAPFYPDVDHDGVGRTDGAVVACEAPLDHVRVSGDCLDTNPDAFPGNPERCDGRDQDCDGLIDEDPLEGPDWFIDADGDGYGDWRQDSVIACAAPAGRVDNDEDCDDANAAEYPGAPEACLEDADCDGVPRWCPFVGEFHALDIAGARIDAPDRLRGGRESWCSGAGDIDGDGLPDVTLAASGYSGSPDDAVSGRGGVWIVLGSRLLAAGSILLPESDYQRYGERLDRLGDAVVWLDTGAWVLAVGAAGNGAEPGYVELIAEPVADGDSAVVARYDGYDDSSFGAFLGAWDANLDGVDDLLIGDAVTNSRIVELDLFSEGEFTRDDGDAEIDGLWGDLVTADVTGDGVDDLIAGNWTYDDLGNDRGGAFIYEAPLSAGHVGADDADATVLGQFNNQREGSDLGEPADFDGDGYIDLVTMSSHWPSITSYTGPGRVNVMKGPLSGVSDTGKATWTYSGSSYTTKLGIAAISPDLDGDGSPDMVAACRENDDARGADGGAAGAVHIFYGALPPGDYRREEADAVIRGDNGGAHLGRDVMATLGDLDGDGTEDIIVGSNGNTDPEVDLAGQFFIFFGASAPDPE